MLGFVGAKEAGLEEKRQFPRFPLDTPLYLNIVSPKNNKPLKARALNISPQGLLLAHEDLNVSPGEVVHFDSVEEGALSSFSGEVKWTKKTQTGLVSGIYINDTSKFFAYFLSKGINALTSPNRSFLQSILNSFEESVFLLDKNLNIIALSQKQHLISISQDQIINKKITEVPSIIKLLLKEKLLGKRDFLEVLYTKNEKFLKALELEYATNGQKEKYFFNVNIKPILYKNSVAFILVQVKDVTSLFKLKEDIEERDKLHWEQYRFILMGHIVDELLEDIINPLSAAVGRIDLLSMKMSNYRAQMPNGEILENWMNELKIIDGLLEQITRYCTIAAKRREREKLGALNNQISIKKLIKETISIVKINSYFSDIKINLDLKDDLPTLEGEYFDWLNAMIALFQVIAKGMHAQANKEITVKTDQNEKEIILTISHNAKALRLPLEKEIGLSILKLIKRKYNTSITLSGGSGSQHITFYITK